MYFVEGDSFVAGVEDEDGAGEVAQLRVADAGDDLCGAHGGADHLFIVDVGGAAGEVDGADAERFVSAEDAADVVGGADLVEVDADGAEAGARFAVAGAEAGEEVVLFKGEPCLIEMPMHAVGDELGV